MKVDSAWGVLRVRCASDRCREPRHFRQNYSLLYEDHNREVDGMEREITETVLELAEAFRLGEMTPGLRASVEKLKNHMARAEESWDREAQDAREAAWEMEADRLLEMKMERPFSADENGSKTPAKNATEAE